MLASVPFFLVVFGTPLAVVSLIPADWVWRRLMRGRGRDLSGLYLTPASAADLSPRLSAASRSGVLALAAAALGAIAAVVLSFLGIDPRLAGVAGPLVATVALVVLTIGLAVGPHAPRGAGLRATSVERRALAAFAGGLLVLWALLVAAGVVSVPDPPSTRYAAFPRASLVQWYYSFDGYPKDFEYTANGVTAPWPGWFYGVPVAEATLLLGIAVVSFWIVLGRRFGDARASAPVASVRLLSGVLGFGIAVAGACASMIFVTAMAGDVLTSVSVFAKPQFEFPGMLKPMGHTQPEFGLGQVGLYAWVVLGPVGLTAMWLSVFALRGLVSARSVTRRVSAACER